VYSRRFDSDEFYFVVAALCCRAFELSGTRTDTKDAVAMMKRFEW
jgi:hypothetical protein